MNPPRFLSRSKCACQFCPGWLPEITPEEDRAIPCTKCNHLHFGYQILTRMVVPKSEFLKLRAIVEYDHLVVKEPDVMAAYNASRKAAGEYRAGLCRYCQKPVPDSRLNYSTPMCFTCLPPPPEPLPVAFIVNRPDEFCDHCQGPADLERGAGWEGESFLCGRCRIRACAASDEQTDA